VPVVGAARAGGLRDLNYGIGAVGGCDRGPNFPIYMLDSRDSLAYIRILQDGRPRLPAGLGTVQEARHRRRLWPRESLATGHVCLRLPTSRSGRVGASTDDGRRRRGITSTHHSRCVRLGMDHRMLLPTCPRRGGADPRVSRSCRAGNDPDGNHLVRPRSRQGTSSSTKRFGSRRAGTPPRGTGPGGRGPRVPGRAVWMRDSWIHGGPPSCRGRARRLPQHAAVARGGLAQPAAAVQEGDKR